MSKFSQFYVVLLFICFNVTAVAQKIEVKLINNLDASNKEGKKTYFSFSKGSIVEEGEEWDLAFSKTSIYTKCGYLKLEKNFSEVKSVPEGKEFMPMNDNAYLTIQEWYEYTGAPSHLILPRPNQTYVFSKKDGKTLKFAKLEIISYYKDAPKEPSAFEHKSGFYTFRYVFGQDASVKFE